MGCPPHLPKCTCNSSTFKPDDLTSLNFLSLLLVLFSLLFFTFILSDGDLSKFLPFPLISEIHLRKLRDENYLWAKVNLTGIFRWSKNVFHITGVVVVAVYEGSDMAISRSCFLFKLLTSYNTESFQVQSLHFCTMQIQSPSSLKHSWLDVRTILTTIPLYFAKNNVIPAVFSKKSSFFPKINIKTVSKHLLLRVCFAITLIICCWGNLSS